MTDWYGVPNSLPFWHWPTLFHFAFVALAGGMAFVTMVATLRDHPSARRYALITMALIVLDLMTLWAESPARWRFTHVWIFLTFTPTSPIWIGAWGLTTSLAGSLLVWLNRGTRLVGGALLVVGSSLALIYPGLALAVNTNRPMWTTVLVALFPLTAMVTVAALASLFRQAWAATWVTPLSLSSGSLAGLYLWGLATGPNEAQAGFAYLWSHVGPMSLVGLVFLFAPAFLRRLPVLAALVPLAGATIVRSLIVEIGQQQFFGF